MSSQAGEAGPSLSASASKVPIPGIKCPGQYQDCTKFSCMLGPTGVLDQLLPLGSFPWVKPYHIPLMGKKLLPDWGNLSSMLRPPRWAALHPWEPRGIGMAQPGHCVPGQSIPDTSDLGIHTATERTRKRWEVVMETATNWISTWCKEQFV